MSPFVTYSSNCALTLSSPKYVPAPLSPHVVDRVHPHPARGRPVVAHVLQVVLPLAACFGVALALPHEADAPLQVVGYLLRRHHAVLDEEGQDILPVRGAEAIARSHVVAVAVELRLRRQLQVGRRLLPVVVDGLLHHAAAHDAAPLEGQPVVFQEVVLVALGAPVGADLHRLHGAVAGQDVHQRRYAHELVPVLVVGPVAAAHHERAHADDVRVRAGAGAADVGATGRDEGRAAPLALEGGGLP